MVTRQRRDGGASIAVHSRHSRSEVGRRRGVFPPLPLGEGWGEGGGRRGPRDLAEARPPSHTKVSSGRGLAAISLRGTFRLDGKARRGLFPPLPLGEGWGAGGGGGDRATLLKPAPPSHTKVSSGRGLAATPYVRRKGTARALPPSPAGRGLGEGGGRRGPRDLAEARPPSHTKVSSGRGLAATPYVRRKGTARALPPSPGVYRPGTSLTGVRRHGLHLLQANEAAGGGPFLGRRHPWCP